MYIHWHGEHLFSDSPFYFQSDGYTRLWGRKYFVLFKGLEHGKDRLSWYPNQANFRLDPYTSRGILTEAIAIVKPGGEGGEGRGFELITHSGEERSFKADSDAECTAWIRQIETSLKPVNS